MSTIASRITFYHTTEAVQFHFIPGYLNPADILSKHWGYQQVWASALRPILFWKGNTDALLLDREQPKWRTKEEVMMETKGAIAGDGESGTT